MMEILAERQLKLSRKKSRIGLINKGFHFLGIHYPETQPQDHTKEVQAANDGMITRCNTNEHLLVTWGGVRQ